MYISERYFTGTHPSVVGPEQLVDRLLLQRLERQHLLALLHFVERYFVLWALAVDDGKLVAVRLPCKRQELFCGRVQTYEVACRSPIYETIKDMGHINDTRS